LRATAPSRSGPYATEVSAGQPRPGNSTTRLPKPIGTSQLPTAAGRVRRAGANQPLMVVIAYDPDDLYESGQEL